MATKQGTEGTVEVLKDLMTVQLLLAGVPQRNVQKIVKCDINRIAAIAKVLKVKKGKAA